MVIGFRSEAAWESTPKRSKTIAAQRLSSTIVLEATPGRRSICKSGDPGPARLRRCEKIANHQNQLAQVADYQ